jgi:hypothetical protein
MALAGFSGFLVGLLANLLATLALGVVLVPLGLLIGAIYRMPSNVVPPAMTWMGWGIGILASAVQGWVLGGWLGNELGKEADGSRPAPIISAPPTL